MPTYGRVYDGSTVSHATVTEGAISGTLNGPSAECCYGEIDEKRGRSATEQHVRKRKTQDLSLCSAKTPKDGLGLNIPGDGQARAVFDACKQHSLFGGGVGGEPTRKWDVKRGRDDT